MNLTKNFTDTNPDFFRCSECGFEHKTNNVDCMSCGGIQTMKGQIYQFRSRIVSVPSSNHEVDILVCPSCGIRTPWLISHCIRCYIPMHEIAY